MYITKGIAGAISFQEKLVETASFLLMEKKVNNAGTLRYVLMEGERSTELFCKPIALRRLGKFVKDAYESQNNKSARAFVIGAGACGDQKPLAGFGKHVQTRC